MKTPFSLLRTALYPGYLLVFLPLLLASQISSAEPQFRLGEDYEMLQIPVRGDAAGVVHGFFDYRSDTSYRRYLEVSQWSRTLPKDVSVLFYPKLITEDDEALARLFVLIEQLDSPQPIHVALFEAVLAGDTDWQDKLKVETFLVKHGISKSRFRELWGSENVELLIRNTRALVKIYRIKKTPAIIVNGKYLTDRSPTNDSGQPALGGIGSSTKTTTSLLEYLLEKDRVVQAAQTQATQGVLR